MKTSNKILLVVGATPLVCILILALMLKAMPFELNITETTRTGKSSWPTRTFSMEKFHRISSKGTWDIHLVQADDYLVEITAPENVLNIITVKNKNQTLFLEYKHSKQKSVDMFDFKARIHLPHVSEINMEGASNLHLSEITADSISIRTNGLLKVSGSGSKIQNLSFACNGMSKIDLSETPVTNAVVRCGGLFSVDLLMNGGRLKGRLDGIGTLTCEGDISKNEIFAANPLSKVVHRSGRQDHPVDHGIKRK